MFKISEKIFLADANIFITPYNTFYAFDIAPSFWSFLKHNIEIGRIVLIDKVINEVYRGDDELSIWIKSLKHYQFDYKIDDVFLNYREVLMHIQTGVSQRGIKLYNNRALNNWSQNDCADPWLIATAKKNNYTIVTFETPNSGLGTSTTAGPKIPDIAREFGVECCSLFEMMKILGFSFK